MKKSKRNIVVGFSFSLLVLFSFFLFLNSADTKHKNRVSSVLTQVEIEDSSNVGDSENNDEPFNYCTLVEGELRSGDTLSQSLDRYNIDPIVRQQILENLSSCLDFRRLQPKDKYRVFLDDQGQLLRCEYTNGPLESYSITRNDDSFVAQKDSINISIQTCLVEDTISSSLFDAFAKNDLNASLVYAFADIFSSRLDFNTEIYHNDTFQIVFEKYLKNGEVIGYGHILYAKYQQQFGQTYEGFFYQPNSASPGTYFDAEGRELGTSFIKSPVPVGRVTSRFTYRRVHPISGVVKPHLGVDLAAPIGTPIMAAAEGTVTYAGYRGGFGRQVIISHPGGYKTYYGHLSRFRKGLKRGDKISQKQILGYVGSSGISTGPHLDYRIQHGGTFVDPFNLKFKPKSALQGQKLAMFKNHVYALSALLVSSPDPEILYVRHMLVKPDEQLTML